MMGEKDETKKSARELILETAADLFYREGFRAIGIDTIIARSDVAKMTLYHHFPSKDDLIAAYLEQANERFWVWFDQSLGEGTPRDQLERLFDAVGILANSPTCYGCTFQSTAAEFPELEHPGHRVALRHKQRVIERLAALGAEAGVRDPDPLANQLLLLMDGAFVAARMFGPHNPAVHIAQAARQLIAGHMDGR